MNKYFVDRNGNNLKDGTCVNSLTDECYVDMYGNFSEGDLKFKYTQLTSAETAMVKPQAKKPVIFGALYDYGDAAMFAKRVDNSQAGIMRDCAECHVGGGAMEYVPVAMGTELSEGARPELRANPAILAGTQYNTFNYFIDQYDENNDGILGQVLPQNYADTGVMEMDCLMCHMEGYSWDDRVQAIRKGNFDASRVAGAGLGTADNAVAGSTGVGLDGTSSAGYGKTVTYDTDLMVADDGNGNATLSAAALAKIQAVPPSENCSSCHMDMHAVDWKKRGDTWHKDMAYETEVHGSLGCMGCHTRDDGKEMDPNNTIAGTPDTPEWTGKASGAGTDAKTLGHDPSKGNAPYGSLWNMNDNNVRTCAGCHLASENKSYVGFGGAPDPTLRHAQMGLTQTLIQKTGMGKMMGTANGNHLDIITCEACHTRKLGHGPTNQPTYPNNLDSHKSLYEWGTGGAMVDGTGPDPDGRNTDHENLYVERTMENNLAYAWQGNKISVRNALVSMFWLDKDDTFGDKYSGIDVNGDGQGGGSDPVLSTHVMAALRTAGYAAMTSDGDMNGTEIDQHAAALKSYLMGVDPANSAAKLKLSLMGVFFKVNHGTTPAANAWGAGGCKDCHGANKGFYNGPYDMKPRDLQASWSNKGALNWSAIEGGGPGWKYVVPYTAVNTDNYSGRDVSVPICSSYYGPTARPAAPETPAQAAARLGTAVPVTGDVCAAPGTIGDINYGTATGTWTVYALGKIKADTQFTDFHPTVWAKGQPGRSIALATASGTANTIRTMDRSEGLWEANFKPTNANYDGRITGTNGFVYSTRAAWVSYLNGLDNYRPAIHAAHASYDCSVCHSDGDGVVGGRNATYALVSDPALDADEQFTFTIRPVTNTATCATACHDAALAGGVSPSKATARISTQHATDTNFKVKLDGSKSACYGVNMETGEITQGTNTYAWSFSATEPASNTCAGNVASCDATWAAAGTNPVTLTVSCTEGSTSDSSTVGVTGFDVGAGTNADPTLTATVSAGMKVTLQASTLSSEVNDVQILWGDFTRLTVTTATTPNVADLVTADGTNDVAHTYKKSGTYNVTVVTTNDGDPNNKRFTYPLTVIIP